MSISMSGVYDNWERLVEAVLDREELRRLAFCPSLSSASTSTDFSYCQSIDQLSLEDTDVGTTDQETPPADGSSYNNAGKTFTFRELAVATRNFHTDCLIVKGGFGRLYKGPLHSSNDFVAIKQFDLNGVKGNTEFPTEYLMLSLLQHPNLIKLIGHCMERDHTLLVFEYLPLGSLYSLLHEPILGRRCLDWNTRMKIAAGVAKGLEYLHCKASPPVIHRNLMPANIFLGEGYHPKICNFGFATLGPVGEKTRVSTSAIGTYGYCPPEYAMSGLLTLKGDVYSFGVVLLEIISGRKAVHVLETGGVEHIVGWARPFFKHRRKFMQIVDPALQGQYPIRSLNQALSVAAMCLHEQADSRPTMADVVTALTLLSSLEYGP